MASILESGTLQANDGDPNILLSRFVPNRLLNQDQSGHRIILLGKVDGEQSLLAIERAAFPSDETAASAIPQQLVDVKNLGANDVYHWYMARSGNSSTSQNSIAPPDLKLNLITPCTTKHIKKYSPQKIRMVTETPSIYQQHVQPYILGQKAAGRMNWVYNILEGRKEQDDIIYRETRSARYELGHDPEGFLLLPDMNWDRKTVASLRILGLVERRDLLSLRDLKKKDIPWLRGMMHRMLEAVEKTYAGQGIERDCLKVYMHYQPTYYHFHIHILSTAVEPNATQAMGKAFSLPNLISQLETMQGGPEAGLQDVTLTYSIGEESDLWTIVFCPIKEGKLNSIDQVTLPSVEQDNLQQDNYNESMQKVQECLVIIPRRDQIAYRAMSTLDHLRRDVQRKRTERLDHQVTASQPGDAMLSGCEPPTSTEYPRFDSYWNNDPLPMFDVDYGNLENLFESCYRRTEI